MKAEQKKVNRMVSACMRELMKAEHEIPMPKGSSAQAMKATKVVDKAWRGATYGGCRGIQINLGYWQLINESVVFKEYKAFESDPVIGSRAVNDADDKLLIIVAHEVAHYVQYTHAKSCKWLKAHISRPHGRGFQDIYRILRSRVVNPAIDSKMGIRKAAAP